MSKSIPEEKKQEWKANIRNQLESGSSIKRWCRENNISEQAFHYWRRRLLLQTSISRSSFTEIVDKERTGIILECQGIQIHLERQFDPSILKRCLEVLKVLKC